MAICYKTIFVFTPSQNRRMPFNPLLVCLLGFTINQIEPRHIQHPGKNY